MPDLDALIERVRGAAGPCLDLDTDIHLAIVLKGWVRHPHAKPGTWLYRELWPSAEAHAAWAMDSNSEAPTEIAPKYTASLDAATALAERCLPGWHIERLSDDISPSGEVVGASVLLENFLGCYGKMGSGKTRALALLAAILTAIKAQEGKLG